MSKIRLYELAKELGCDSKTVVETLHNLGVSVKNHMSTIDVAEQNQVKKVLQKAETPKAGAEKAQPAKKEQAEHQPKQQHQTKQHNSERKEQQNNRNHK